MDLPAEARRVCAPSLWPRVARDGGVYKYVYKTALALRAVRLVPSSFECRRRECALTWGGPPSSWDG
eukprot:5157372-Pyramimonas_sp.AAC.1